VQRLVAQVQSVQPLRVRNDTPNAAIKVQTVVDSSQQRRQIEP